MATPNEWRKRALDAEKRVAILQAKLNKSEYKVFDMAMTRLNNNWQNKFDMIVQMFAAVTDQIKGNERHGRIIIESLRMGITKFEMARTMNHTAEAIAEIKADNVLLVQWYDDIGYVGIGEWFKAWTADVNAIDNDADNAGQIMDKVIENHGFDFKRKTMGLTWQEMAGIKTRKVA